jgi:hypothetical protein
MADPPVPLYDIQYRRLFPWLHLTRAFWIAIDPRKLLLAGAALMLASLGTLLIDQLPFSQAASPEAGTAQDAGRWPWQWSLGYDRWHGNDGAAELRGAIHDPRDTLFRISSNWQIVLLPFRRFVEPAALVFRGGMKTGQLADAVTRALWNLIVWSLFAGAICRIAAVQFARDQQIGMRRALAFAGTRFFGYVSAPLLPLVGVAILWALCVVGGWIGRIPGGVGEGLLGVLWGLELLFGFMMAVVLTGVAAGWPLMFATISVEGTDGFDGLSRAYNYVFERPLYLLWQAVVTMFYGSFMIFLVWLLGQILAQLTVWGVSWGMGYERTVEFAAGSPDIVSPAGTAWESPSAAWGAQIARGWMCLLGVVVTGFVHTFFWTSATIAYFLLRHSVDGNEFDEVYAEEVEERDELLPLVGTAAMSDRGGPSSPAGSPPPPDVQQPAPAPPVDLAP